MSDLRTAAQQARLRPRETLVGRVFGRLTVVAQAEQPAEQEPVAWCDQYESHIDGLRHYSDGSAREIPLYTVPQPRRNVTYVCQVCAASLERQE